MMNSKTIKIPSNDPNTYCRLCFSNRNLVALSPNDEEPQKILLEQISQYIGIEINPVGELPCSICWRCAVALEDFQIFRQRSLEHDAVLRGICSAAFIMEENHNQQCINEEEKTNCIPTPPDDADSSSSYNQTGDISFMDQSPFLSNTPLENTEIDFIKQNSAKSPKPARIFTCRLCKTKFSTQASLFDHLKKQHSDRERPFKCTYCPAAFKRKAHVVNHMSSHIKNLKAKLMQEEYHSIETSKKSASPKEVFECAHCSRNFKEQRYLTLHIKYMHPVSWSECGERQNENQNLETQDFVGPDQTIDEFEPVIVKSEIWDSDSQDGFGIPFP